MSDFIKLFSAIDDRDAAAVRSAMLASEFVLLSIADGEDDDQECYAAFTAQVGELDTLVAFTSQQAAGVFVDEMSDMFGDEEGVDGFIVEGGVLLENLPEGHGLLLDPETDNAAVLDPELIAAVNQSAE